MKEKLDILTTEANVFSGASAALLIKTTAEHIKMCLSYPSRLRVFFGIILNQEDLFLISSEYISEFLDLYAPLIFYLKNGNKTTSSYLGRLNYAQSCSEHSKKIMCQHFLKIFWSCISNGSNSAVDSLTGCTFRGSAHPPTNTSCLQYSNLRLSYLMIVNGLNSISKYEL